MKLINRAERTDLLKVWFDPLTVRRMWGFFDSASGRSSQKPDTLCGVYGLSADELRTLLDGPTADVRMDRAVDLYERRLAGAFATKSHSVSGFAKVHMLLSQLDRPT